tara:strand:- start:359 stop:1285 length:927 start_codon:yes stop_codon:yes gene_type:complete
MAINVDQVYKTVLLIINKEQRGYLTPDEFNKIGTQVQLDIFESYFETLNQQLRFPQNDSDYANRVKTVNEKIDVFKRIQTCTFTAATSTESAYFTIPAQLPSTTETITTILNQKPYALTTLTQAQINPDYSNVTVTKDGAAFSQQDNWSIASDIFTLDNKPDAGLEIIINIAPLYKLGTVIYNDEQELQPIQRSELVRLNLSSYTKPSTDYPVYLYENDKIIMYPQSVITGVEASYVQKPSNPVWNFTSSVSGYVYAPTTSTDFQLHISEQTNVILQVLLYAGVVIKDPSIVQAAAGEIAQTEQNERT